MGRIGIWVVAVTFLGATWGEVRAAATPEKPLEDLVAEVMAFLLADVGIGGIRTEDDQPGGDPVPPWFYHYAIRHDDVLWSNTSGYPGYASISYPGYTVSVAIDAYLAWWAWSGDPEGLARAREAADWLIPRRTPASDVYGNWVYSTQTDGVMGGGFDGDAIMSDKPGMFGLRCLRLWEITQDPVYRDTAHQIGVTYRDTQLTGGVEDAGRWPFRVRPSDGLVRQDYTSHLIPAIRLLERLDALFPGEGFGASAAAGWQWLEANPLDPNSPNHHRWAGFYEDIDATASLGLLDHYSAENTLDALLTRDAPGDRARALDIFQWSTTRYLAPDTVQNGWGTYDFAILEWDAWPNTTYAATGQWAYSALRLDTVLAGTPDHDPTWRPDALRALHNLTYGQGDEPQPADTRMLTTVRELSQPQFGIETWYEQNFNTVKYAILGMDLAPELGPASGDHLVGFDGGELRSHQDTGPRLLTTWSAPGEARFRLDALPMSVRIDGQWFPTASTATPGWSWDPVHQRLTIRHSGGEVEIARGGVVAVPPAASGPQVGHPHPNPANPTVTLEVTLPTAGWMRAEVVDLRGRVVRTWQGRWPAGSHALRWDGCDPKGHPVASGSYLWRVTTAAGTTTRTLALVR